MMVCNSFLVDCSYDCVSDNVDCVCDNVDNCYYCIDILLFRLFICDWHYYNCRMVYLNECFKSYDCYVNDLFSCNIWMNCDYNYWSDYPDRMG